MNDFSLDRANVIVDSLSDGLYVCDKDRRIVYWSKAAERITGWTPEDVIGHKCSDNILCHIDKDGRRLCGEDFCPLHRAMVTNKSNTCPIIVFGQTKAGDRVPMIVTVAPVHDEAGQVIGGVECFRDYSTPYNDLKLAQRIQSLALEKDLPQDSRIEFSTFYVPHDMVGGDYFSIRRLESDFYGFFLADVMGHGISAALHTMHLSSLWERHCHTLTRPAEFAQTMNRALCQVVKDESFATAICGVIDAANKTVRLASAGGPPAVWSRADGHSRQIASAGVPLGMFEFAEYVETEFHCTSGDHLLMFTDGAVEIYNANREMLDTAGLIDILNKLDYPRSPLQIETLQKELLNYSDGIRLEDDLTLLEVRFL